MICCFAANSVARSLIRISCVICRPKWEGGEYEGDDKQRLEALLLAMELGADYVDVELKVGFISEY